MQIIENIPDMQRCHAASDNAVTGMGEIESQKFCVSHYYFCSNDCMRIR